MTQLLPNRSLVELEFPMRFRSESFVDAPPEGDDEVKYALPPTMFLDGMPPFGEVMACWNDDGLSVAVRVIGKYAKLRCNPKGFWKSDHLRVCTDMRDARSIRRATRFCQQFYFLPTGGGSRKNQPVAGAHKLQRAREDAPLPQAGTLGVSADCRRDAYFLEGHIPVGALSGFDPREHDRIGFYYMLEDHEFGQQYLTVGDDLLWYVDPSTWATAVLVR